MQRAICRVGDTADRANPARLEGSDREHAAASASAVSGVILYDETIRQQNARRHSVRRSHHRCGNHSPASKSTPARRRWRGIPEKKCTEGLDGLRERLSAYVQMGARFAKWRAVIAVGDAIPSRGCIDANAHALARYAALCQESWHGAHRRAGSAHGRRAYAGSLQRGHARTSATRFSISSTRQRVVLEGMILKPNMVLPGSACPKQASVEEVADATVECFLQAVPAAVPGIAFLSGGQSAELASARLNAMNVRFGSRAPWALTFSFSRAIQQPAMEIWRGSPDNVVAAHRALSARVRCNRAARLGQYDARLESTSA